ncbi:TonB-linked outer membrane protein, SusC/RagA family [Dyadobacter soli]|uniref:TonB-linked outer membrane protein, SusC/RagA family n=1 Tax=Dyadobacter soli TaxID=659014 RepID=A0A1G7VGM4_9BACT|nr:TonB-dependent receptor [Dyadobacter soli]SDG58976.1 TonB-linked outer membrane protein, SusC/RagA family [Dyadobacter soli]
MKKNILGYYYFVWLMKISALPFLMILSCTVSAIALDAHAQDLLGKRVSIDSKNLSIQSLLIEIERQANVRFVFSPALIESGRQVSVNVRNQTISQVLDKYLKPIGIGYDATDKVIVLRSDKTLTRPVPDTPAPAVQTEQKKVSGSVTDEKGGALPGVSVLVKGTTTGTTTDVEGNFTLDNLDDSAVLIFSFVGYIAQEVAVGAQSVLRISLKQDMKELEELVVVGYGTIKKANLTGAVSSIDSKAIENRPITNASQALQGLPGVYVNMNQGRPGADGASITIRGASSYNTETGTGPLVLVDGVEFSLRDVNPNDIEKVTVLKDAASAAIYGSRAQNGVVLVTTKTGQKNTKVRVDYSGYLGVQQATRLPGNVVTNTLEYMEGKNRALANEGRAAEYSQALMDEYRNGKDPYVYPNTDWFKLMFRNAAIQEHNVRLSGGSDRSTYSVSLGYLNQKGILPGSGAQKYSFSTNINSDVTPWLTIGSNVIATWWDNNEGAYTANDANGEGGIMGLIYRGLPMQTNLAQDGTYADQWIRVPGHNFFRNPYALSLEGRHLNKSLRGIANLYAQVNLPFGVKYKITVAPNMYFENEKYNYPVIPLTNTKTGEVTNMGNIPPRGVSQASGLNFSFTNFHTLNWEKNFKENHYLNVLGGFSLEHFSIGRFTAQNQGYLGNEITELNGGSLNPVVSGTSTKSRIMSTFGRVNYVFKDKYLFETNFRVDGSSRFEQSRRWGFFPSFSAGWRISEENFLKDIRTISNLKLRASWGQLGNQNIPLFSYVNAVELNSPVFTTNYSFNNVVSSGAAVRTLADPTVGWESTTASNVGIDGGLFNNKLTFEFDLFRKYTDGILARVNLPAQVGNLQGPLSNIGSVSNKGYELTVGYRDRAAGINYNLAANITHLINKVENTDGAILYNTNRIIQEGSPINSFFGLQSLGLFQSKSEIDASPFQNNVTNPGDIKYKDQNGDGKIDSGDRVVIGQSNPGYTYTFTAGADYKGFDFAMFWQGTFKLDTYVTANLAQPYKNGAGVTREWLTDSWTPENPNASLPRLTTANGYPQNFQVSDFWLQSIAYLRLKNVQLGYTIPADLVKKLGLSRVRLYLNGQNLITVSKFRLGDPERDPAAAGVVAYPIAKVASFGLNVSF